jgi:hypothetical protein
MTTFADPRPVADTEQDELATVDAAYTRAFGQDMATWDVETRALYEDAIADVYRRYTKADV